MTISGDGSVVVTADSAGLVKAWGVQSGREIRELRNSRRAVIRMSVAGNRWLATASADSVKLWDLSSGQELVLSEAPGKPDQDSMAVSSRLTPDDIAFLPGGRGLLAARSYYHGRTEVEIWNLGPPALQRTHRIQLPGGGCRKPLFVAANATLAYAACETDRVPVEALRVWELPSQTPVPVPFDFPYGAEEVSVSPCGRWILVLCYSLERQSWELRSWDIKTNWVGTFPLHLRRGPWPPDPAYPWRPDVSVLQVMPGGLRAIIALEKGEPGLHDLSTGAVLGRFPLQPGPLLSAINTDGNRVLFSGPDDSLRLWQVDPPRELWRIDPRAEIYALSFSLDGNSAFAIVAGGAQVILDWRAWDVGTAQEISPDLAREYCPSPGPHTVRTGPDGIRRQIDWKLNGSLSIRELDGGNDYLLEGQAEPPRDVCQGRSKIRPRWRRNTRPPGRWAECLSAVVRTGWSGVWDRPWGGLRRSGNPCAQPAPSWGGGVRAPGRPRGGGPSCCVRGGSCRR